MTAHSYNLNTDQAVQGSGGTSNRIDETGAYVGEITRAEAITAKSGAVGIEFDFKSTDGKEASFMSIYTHNKDGAEIYGFKKLMAILAVLRLKTIKPAKAKIKKYDFDAKEDLEVDADVYPELQKPIGFVLQREGYFKNNGAEAFRMNIVSPFDPSSKQTADELINKKAAAQVEKMSEHLKDLPATAQTGQQRSNVTTTSTAGTDAYETFDDDILW